jgi:3-hydroxy-9,10-secoandrosta-1,3,5(10)-triene-9,17-dione monooxygenase reductase component
MDSIDPQALRGVLGRFATGVAVVTTMSPADQPVGMTVNSFTSVSLFPPLVLFCAGHRSCLYPAFSSADIFAVNILGEGQMAFSWRFASAGFDRFDTLEPRIGKTGVPLLPTALATLECVTRQRVTAGDHDIIIGEVIELETSLVQSANPLLFYDGTYRSLFTATEWWSALHE